MTTEEQILIELQNLNKKIDKYTNPYRNAWNNFFSGITRAFGWLIGSVIITAVIFYFLSRINFDKIFQDVIQRNLTTPSINSLFSQPSPGQL